VIELTGAKVKPFKDKVIIIPLKILDRIVFPIPNSGFLIINIEMKKVINMINPSSKVAGVSLLKLKKTKWERSHGSFPILLTAPIGPFFYLPILNQPGIA
jgi:hypothetical protein